MSKKLNLALIGEGYWGKNLARSLNELEALKVACGNTRGKFAFIGAGSMVTDQFPDNGAISVNSAKTIGWMCGSGERLEDNPDEAKCSAPGKSYLLKKNKIQPVI